MAGSFMKCVHKFEGEVAGDLSLEVGDVVHVTKAVSDEWYEGVLNGHTGQFPKSFVEETTDKGDVFNVAIALSAFEGEQDDDLTLHEGEVVVITEIIDENWAVGYTHGGHKGTFPRAFVKQISFEDSVMKDALQAAVPAFTESEVATDSHSNDGTEVTADSTGSKSEVSDSHSNETEVSAEKRYVVVSPFAAQGDTELNLKPGDLVEVTSAFDDFWLEGRLDSGDTGLFPRTCVDYPDDVDDETDNSQVEETIESKVTSSAEVPPEIETEPAVETPVETPESYVVAVFDYTSSMEGDLNFKVGDHIKILKVVDDNWYCGEFSGAEGVFPSNHVEPVKSPEPMTAANISGGDKSFPLPLLDNDVETDISASDTGQSEPDPSTEDIGGDSGGDDSDFPPPPSEEVLSDLEDKIEEDQHVNITPVTTNTKKDILKKPPVKKQPPSRPVSGPKKPSKPPPPSKKTPPPSKKTPNTTENLETLAPKPSRSPAPSPKISAKLPKNVLDTTATTVVAEKPKKKAPPERPKMPVSKKDMIPPFSYQFDTESQPLVIIPGRYVKEGEPNVIILRRSQKVC